MKIKIVCILILIIVVIWGIFSFSCRYSNDSVIYTSSEMTVELKSVKQSGELVEIELEFNSEYPGRIIFKQEDFAVVAYDGEEIDCIGTTLVGDNVPSGVTDAKVRFKTDIKDIEWVKIKNKYIRIG